VIGPTEPLMLRMADGRLIGPISGPPMESGSDVEIRPLAGVGPRIFDRCPICFDSATDDAASFFLPPPSPLFPCVTLSPV